MFIFAGVLLTFILRFMCFVNLLADPVNLWNHGATVTYIFHPLCILSISARVVPTIFSKGKE
jgi:hypothetical protein